MPNATPPPHTGSAFFSSGSGIALETLDTRQVDAVEDHLEGAGAQFDAAGAGGGVGEVVAALLQALAPQAQAVAAPVEDLEPVGGAVAEDEQVARQRVGVQPGGDQGEQTVERGIFLIPLAAKTARTNPASPSPSSILGTPSMARPSA
jgi:hypothetical protein